MELMFLSAFVAGLAYAVAPGVVNAEALRRALTDGFRAALLFQLGALAGDVFWAAVALSGVVAMRLIAGMHLMLGTCGAVFLVWMGWSTMRDSCCGHAPRTIKPSRHSDLLLGALLALANPFTVVFWLSIGGGLLVGDVLAPQLLTTVTAVGAIILANLIWSVLLATLASYGRRLVTITLCRWLSAVTGVCLALFGIGLFWRTLAAL